MENKKAVLKRTFEEIRELFEDAKRLEKVVDTISSKKDFEKLSLTGNVIIHTLVTKLNDVDDELKNIYSVRMKRKREKMLMINQVKLEKDKEILLKNEVESSGDEIPSKITKITNENIDENKISDQNDEHNLSKSSVKNNNPNSESTPKKVVTFAVNNEEEEEEEESKISNSENEPSNKNSQENKEKTSKKNEEKLQSLDRNKKSSSQKKDKNSNKISTETLLQILSTTSEDNPDEVLSEKEEIEQKQKKSTRKSPKITSDDDTEDEIKTKKRFTRSKISKNDSKKNNKKCSKNLNSDLKESDEDILNDSRRKSKKKNKIKHLKKTDDADLVGFSQSEDEDLDNKNSTAKKVSKKINTTMKLKGISRIKKDSEVSESEAEDVSEEKLKSWSFFEKSSDSETTNKNSAENEDKTAEKEICEEKSPDKDLIDSTSKDNKDIQRKDGEKSEEDINSLNIPKDGGETEKSEKSCEDSNNSITNKEIGTSGSKKSSDAEKEDFETNKSPVNKTPSSDELEIEIITNKNGKKSETNLEKSKKSHRTSSEDICESTFEENCEINKDKSPEKEIADLNVDKDKNNKVSEETAIVNISADTDATIFLENSVIQATAESSIVAEKDNSKLVPDAEKSTENKSELPLSVDRLDKMIQTFLLSQSTDDDKNDKVVAAEAEIETETNGEKADESVILVEQDYSLIVVDEDSKTSENCPDLVGKIKVIDIGRLTKQTEDEKASKIKATDFARLSNPIAKEIVDLSNLEEDSSKPRRSRKPQNKNFNEQLQKLKEKRERRLERERLLQEEQEKIEKSKKKHRRKSRQSDKNNQSDNNHKRKNKSKFVIPNNVPIAVKANIGEDGICNYSIVNPEELLDKKFLTTCFVRMSALQTPEELLQAYKDRPRSEEGEGEELEVTLDDEDSSDGESDCSTTMVSGSVGKRTKSLPLRTCNSKPNSSKNSSRNSSANSRSQRSTRNNKPIVEKEISTSSDEEEDEEDDDEDSVEEKGDEGVATKGKGRGRPRKNDIAAKNGKDVMNKKKELKDDSSDDDDDDDAISHVSISSSSEPEIKKSANKKNTVKMEKKISKASKSIKSNDESDEDGSDSDSLPLGKLPDKKMKKEELSDSDDFEPLKKKDKKNNKKGGSDESDIDSDDSISAKKKIANKRRGKKKRVVSDSGSDYDRDNDSDEIESIKSSASEEKEKENPTKKQTRKRIKRVNDDSSDDNSGRKSKKGKKAKGEPIDTRKHIRSIIGKGALNQSTIDAELEESDRKKRISEKQKKYNEIYNPEDLETTKLKKVVLDIDDETNEEILSVDKSIVKHLKPHQAKGIQFMWNASYESVDMVDGKGSGCILAHCMGLGKTLQVIALIHTLITNSDTTKTESALVVCPLSTVLNWVSEFKKWLKDDVEFEVYELVSSRQVSERQDKIADWKRHGGVMIMGYDMFRNLSNPDNKRINKKARTTFVTGLVDPGPDLVICDEGHLLKNEKTSISIAMNRIRTLRRIVLTGTPLQNNLKEYFCMVQFVKPNLLGTYKEYLNRFVNPITNGQYTDSTPHDIQIMRKRSHVLHKMLDGIVQRRDYAVLAPYLPPKHEYVIFVTLTDIQINLYNHYLNVIAPQLRTQASKGVSLFKDFQEFQRICTHPRVLLDKSVHDQIAKWKEEEDAETDATGSLKDFIDDDEDAESTSSETSKSSFSSGKSDDAPRRGRSKPKPQRTTRAVAAEKGIDVVAATSSLEVANSGSEWWREFTTNDNLDDLLCSSKLALLFEILHQCELIGDKVLIFSQSLYSLTVIEYFLSKIDDAQQTGDTRSVGGYASSWALGLDYFRLDGSSSCDNRAAWCKTFNNPKNTRARLFLISTRAGGLGINLVAANRVIIFDVSWNPSHDIQSIYRVYRFGQIKPSFIYRFVTNGTMEMKVYERQVTKQAISKRVIDEQQIDRHYNQNDLAELYKFEPKPEHRPTPPVPKDVLLGELVHDKVDLIYKYHEHHTLLENKEDEELNEAERKAAWEEFENEKKMRQMPAHINNIPIHSIMLGMSNHLKREHPDWSAAEIQTAVPSMVQEMQEKMLLGDVTLYNSMIIELRNLQQQQQQLQQQRMQDYYRLQQQNQERMLMERHRQLIQNNATVSYLQRLYANATAGNLNPAALSALNALGNTLGNRQLNTNQPQIIETVDIND